MGARRLDHRGPARLHDDDLAALTNGNFPPPLVAQYITSGGIKVKVTPLDKGPSEYRESREYVSDDEESRYEIVLRYNRLV